MMKKFLKNQKGVNLISLSVTIIILLILSGVILYNLRGNLGIQRLQAMQSDIQNIREKVAIYYTTYEKLPTSVRYENISALQSAGILGSMDTGNFYLVDLTELENVTLNYGEDFKAVKEGGNQNELVDVYIINENSHNIFYVEGVTVDDVTYYTDYTAEDVENDGSDIELQQLENINKISEARNSERVFIKNKTIKDDFGNELIVPEGFKIAEDSADNVTGGVVIEDVKFSDTVGNQYVWVPVGKVYTDEERTEANAKTITLGRYTFASNGTPTAVQTQTGTTYTATTSASGINSYYYEFKDDAESQSINSAIYGNTKAKDLASFVESTLTNGGYYIARYEAGISGTTDNGSLETKTVVDGSVKPLSQRGKGVWNSITQPDSARVCQNMYTGINSDLINSYAWDTAIVFIQSLGTNSNYSQKTSLQNTLTTTGNASDGTNKDKQCNIYDMAGNVYEWSTEANTNPNSNSPCVCRGGNYYYNYIYTADRLSNGYSVSNTEISFRPILYFK